MPRIRPQVTAVLDPALHATLDTLTPLHYSEAPEPHHDLPPYVRAASAVRCYGRHLVIVQDDVNALAIYDRESADVFPLLLPRGAAQRRRFDDVIGNKPHKMDLESLALLPDERLVAFGSGASAARESLVVLSRNEPPAIRDGGELFRYLRGRPEFAGSQLNIEGAVVQGERLLLLQRGNGARGPDRGPANAIGALGVEELVEWLDGRGPPPALVEVTPFDLGSTDGARFGFTDAAVAADGRLAIVACAERTPDALLDGPVLACRFGWLEPGGELRMTDVRHAGQPSRLKLEGIEARAGSGHDFDVVADGDAALEPALLGRLRVVSKPGP